INDFESNQLQSSNEALEIENLITKTKRQLSLESQTKTNQGETKSIKIAGQIYQEPMAIDND
ncbi:1936_t:CDS:1, partial [Entrophospora sp. SA101]